MISSAASLQKAQADPHLARPPIGRKQAGLEIACLVICVELIMWAVPFTPNPRAANASLSLLILVLLITCFFRDGDSPRELGFRLDNFSRVLRRISLPLCAFVLLLILAGYAAGTLQFGRKFVYMLLFVPSWALLQQYMLLAFVNRRFRLITGSGRSSAIATAALFGLLHLPNPILTIACAVGGYIWAREYEREPNLYATALTHAVASAFLANSLPGSLLKNMVVGYNYFFR